MNKIWSIYVQDMKNISSNWAAAVIIGGLVLLPSLYAWFNIEASWDPYSSTGGIKIAVTTLDQGTLVQGKELNLGNEIKKSLETNTSIGWVFVPHEEARRGLERGDYYASLEIPPDFSERIASVLSPTPVKAEILYSVNEKINAVAPKITSKGASSITQEVNRNFVKIANGTIFKKFNEIGVELQKELPLINKMKALIYQLVTLFPDINRAVDTTLKDLEQSQKIAAQVKQQLPAVTELAQEGRKFSGQLSHFLDQSSTALNQSAPLIKQALIVTRDRLEAAGQLVRELKPITPEDINQAALDRLQNAEQHLSQAMAAAQSFASLTDQLNQLSPGTGISGVRDRIAKISENVQALKNKIIQIHDEAAKNEASYGSHIDEFLDTSDKIANDLNLIINRYDREIVPAINQTMDQAKNTVSLTQTLLTEAQHSLPKVQQILQDASKGLEFGTQVARLIKARLPATEAKLRSLSDRIKAFEQEGRLEDLIRLLQLNYQKESEFFAEPVILVENKLFPIPNYGSAMSPFFTTLSLWVGGLLLVSMLTVEVHDSNQYRSYQVYVGRFLTFGTLALLQSVFVSTGDLYILGTYAKEKLAFVLFSLLLSLVFMLMIYTLVSVFGNVGKAMAIVLLVLQLAGSGGTFPIQVTPHFFQVIYPFLPFTYGIGLLREAVGGIVPELMVNDILILLLYALLALVLGLVLKRRINRLAAPMVQKARKSGIIH